MEETKYVTSSRYDRPKRNKSNFVREHVLIAEKKIGRKLTDGEVVHHIDRNKSNNDPENLMIFASNSDHSAFHKGYEIYETDGIWHAVSKTCTCELCGKVFCKPFGRKTYGHTYCSIECSSKAKREFEISKEDLESLLIKNRGNFSKVGIELGVTDNAVRKRCKRLGLPTHSSDYK